jgi:ubiquinone/menaquinone biosynthesis C-methylase UbiE
METKNILEQFYGNYDEDNRLRSRHGMVEFLTTMRYIEKYLKPGMRILEIGAGTGRYSHTIAGNGYTVDAVELVQSNIDIFKANIKPEEKITIWQGDARDLSEFADNRYDVTLLLGPMYHLFTEEDQHKALSEAIRVTKPGGVIFAAYCGNDATLVQFCFQRGMIKNERYKNLIDPVTFKAGSDPSELFQLYRKEEIDGLMANFSVTRLHYVGTDLATNYMRETVDAMDDEVYELYLRYHFAVCERSDLVGASHHILDVFRKEG